MGLWVSAYLICLIRSTKPAMMGYSRGICTEVENPSISKRVRVCAFRGQRRETLLLHYTCATGHTYNRVPKYSHAVRAAAPAELCVFVPVSGACVHENQRDPRSAVRGYSTPRLKSSDPSGPRRAETVFRETDTRGAIVTVLLFCHICFH